MKRILIAAIFLGGCSCQPEEPPPVPEHEAYHNEANATDAPLLSDEMEEANAVEPTPTTANRIPTAFHGTWDRTVESCGTEGSDTRLRIEADRIRFYESVGTVIAVAGSAPEVTVRASYTGEGETWENSRTFRLSEDGRTLRAEGMVRLRCP